LPPYELECAPAARDTRQRPARGTLDGLIAVLERVAASRAADRERELEEPGHGDELAESR